MSLSEDCARARYPSEVRGVGLRPLDLGRSLPLLVKGFVSLNFRFSLLKYRPKMKSLLILLSPLSFGKSPSAPFLMSERMGVEITKTELINIYIQMQKERRFPLSQKIFGH